ncbi:hypothetical protein F5I97DRAFT_1923775 [Phlebopus sp. FC_14]|nr:hypothetical protein F5I97DRAFT_1923775 [Phlebopus sp. FC_14]
MVRKLSLDIFHRPKDRPSSPPPLPVPPPKSPPPPTLALPPLSTTSYRTASPHPSARSPSLRRTSPPLSPISFTYQSPTGSKFTEDQVSAVLSSETASYVEGGGGGGGGGGVVGGSWRRLRTSSSRLQKSRRAPLPIYPSPDVDEVMSVPETLPGLPSLISFHPTDQPPESFSEDDRLKVRSHENPYLVLLRAVAPHQSERCLSLLRTSLPTDRDTVRDIIPQHNGFVKSVIEAYNNHRALIIRPDDVWLAILTQFTFFVNGHADAFRSMFLGSDGKRELVIPSSKNRYSADHALMARQMTDLMREQIPDPTLREWVMPNFTTTTVVDTAAYAMVMMATMKECFPYKFVLRCGIPRVTLEGEKKDWESILTRLERLKKYGIQTIAWYHLLRPVISRFVSAYDTPHSPENLEFWNKVAHSEFGSGPQWLSGWITAFCVFNEQGEWQGNPLNEERIREHEPKKLLRPADPLHISPSQFASVYTIRERRKPHLVLDGFPYPTIDSQDIPCGYACVDVKLDDHGRVLDTVMMAGLIGSQICSTDKSELFRNGMRDSVRPVVGWWYFMKS